MMASIQAAPLQLPAQHTGKVPMPGVVAPFHLHVGTWESPTPSTNSQQQLNSSGHSSEEDSEVVCTADLGGQHSLSEPLFPPPDPSEGPDAAAEYELYQHRWQEGCTLAQRWARLAASGKLSSIQADWEDLQMDMMLQDSAANKAKATAAAAKRAERRGRAEIDADAVLPAAGEGRTVRCRTANKMLQDFQVELPMGMTAGRSSSSEPEPPSPAAPAAPPAAGVHMQQQADVIASSTARLPHAAASAAFPSAATTAAAAAHRALAVRCLHALHDVFVDAEWVGQKLQQAEEAIQQLDVIFASRTDNLEGIARFMQFAERFQHNPASLLAFMQASVDNMKQRPQQPRQQPQ